MAQPEGRYNLFVQFVLGEFECGLVELMCANVDVLFGGIFMVAAWSID